MTEAEIRDWVASVQHASETMGGGLANPNAQPAIDLLAIIDQLRAERLDLLVKVSLLRDYFNIAREALATATNWSAKGAHEAEALWQASGE